MKCWNLVAAVTLAVTAAPALAGHVVIYDPEVAASVSSSTVGVAFARAANGAVIEAAAFGEAAFSIDALGPTRTAVSGQTQGSFAGVFNAGTVSAIADLATGSFAASVGSIGPGLQSGHSGFAFARLADTLFFTNTSGGDLSLTFRFAFDGLVEAPNSVAGLTVDPRIDIGMDFVCTTGGCPNDDGVAVRFANTGLAANDQINAYIDKDGLRMFARNIFGDQNPPFFDNFQTWQAAPYGSGGSIDGWMQTTLLVPTGLSSLGVRGYLSLDCRTSSNCDFGNTGTFSFVGGLPAGLRVGSASGAFLAGVIPEPASWAMLIAGFGLVGASLRRRRATATA